MKRFYLLSVLMVMFTISVNAQLEVNSLGYIYINLNSVQINEFYVSLQR